jgi:hypothetical protein
MRRFIFALGLAFPLIVGAPEQSSFAEPQAAIQHRAHDEYEQHKQAAIRINELAQRIHSEAEASDHPVYSPDPDHIWNRMFCIFYVRHGPDGRQYGGDELDPYLWPETKYLLSGSSHDEPLKLLDEFLQQHSEKLIADPLKRGLFQRDLLAVNDWLSFPFDEQVQARSELQKRIAEVIRRLALTEDQIRRLPDNYELSVRGHLLPSTYDHVDPQSPFPPADLFDSKGPWYVLGNSTEDLLPLTIWNSFTEDQFS